MTSPVQLEASQLAGSWVASGSGGACAIELTVKRSGTGHVAVTDTACLAKLGLSGVAIWRPAPDGIALARSEGPIVAFFSKRGDCYVHQPKSGGAELTLRRK